MVSVLKSELSRPGSSPGQGYCVVFLGKTQCLSVPPLEVYSCTHRYFAELTLHV